jgi:uncharacterized protein (DUF58 family)
VGDYIYFLLFVLIFIAVVLREDTVLTLVYLLVGAMIAGMWWSRRSLAALRAKRIFPGRVFFGEQVPIHLEISSTGWLPVIWLQIHESLPSGLIVPPFFRQVVSMGFRGRREFDYLVEGRRRGYYPIGPLNLHSGDPLGVVDEQQLLIPADYLTVYPKIIPLTKVSLPSHSPLGTLRHKQPIFEDPTRVLGKRDYISGDSLRRIDWKATASCGRLQVKLFEPSIALETAIFLNLNSDEYEYRTRIDASELAIVVASSLANWVIGQRQAAGLVTNGVDPDLENACPQPVPPRRGRGHLMRILDVLARVETGDTIPFAQLVRQQAPRLSWGTTLILITNQAGEELFKELFQARREGLNAMLVLCGIVSGYAEIHRKAEYFGFPLYHFQFETDLDVWRK